mmetsp:Transcript_3964/g.8090  ORF Transcript_3964/g.8090 Transcript_3964/m.8090 type:complete len:144 (-) Transcript_3964:119-550(-)
MNLLPSRPLPPNARLVWLLVLVLVVGTPAVESLQVSPKTSKSRNQLTKMSVFSPLKSSTPTQRLPAWITRPYKRDSSSMMTSDYNIININNDDDRSDANELLMDGELLVGRLAMVGGVLLLAREVATGASFQEQIQQTLSTFS